MTKTTLSLFLVLIVFTCQKTIAQWMQTNPCGGTIITLLTSGDNLFVGGYHTGVCLSTDNGVSWTQKNTGPGNGNIFALNALGKILFAGTDGSGIFRSANNGSTWNSSGIGVTNKFIWSFAGIGSTLYAATNGGIFRSVDSGANWVAVNKGLLNDTVHTLLANGSNLFAGTLHGVSLSTDNGTSWQTVNDGLNDHLILCFGSNGNTIFAGTADSGIFVTTNNGTNWTKADTGLTNREITSILVQGSDVFAGTYGGGIFRTIDNGNTWMPVNNGLTNLNVGPLASSGLNIIAGTYNGNGIYVSSNDGKDWILSTAGPLLENSGINTLNVFGSVLYVGSDDVASSSDHFNISRSADFASSWSYQNTGLTGKYEYIDAFAAPDPNDPKILFTGTYNNGVFRSTDSGTTWVPVSKGMTNIWVNDLMSSDSILYAGTWSGLFRSTDFGASWNAINKGLSTDSIVMRLSAIPTTDPPALFIGAYDGSTSSTNIYFSSNRGDSWTKIGSFQGLINSLPVFGKELFAATDSGVFTTSDKGKNWTIIQMPSKMRVTAVFEIGSNLFLGSDSGVYLSTNRGSNWNAINTGLPLGNTIISQGVSALASIDKYLIAGTYSNGVWRRPLQEVLSSAVTSKNVPSNLLLKQNYPNPFSESTTIPFDLPERTFVSLKVYDITGREVAVLANEMMDAGSYTRTFNAEKIPSGTYICHLEAGGFRQERTLFLLR